MKNPIQHVAVLREAGGLDEFQYRRDPDAKVDYVLGRKSGGRWVTLSVRFNLPTWETEDAKAWLSNKGYSPDTLVPATKTVAEINGWYPVQIDVVKPGKVVDMYGRTLDITREGFIRSVEEAFAEEQAYMASLPELKYSHMGGVDAIGVGHASALWYDKDTDWLRASGLMHDGYVADNVNKGHGACSLEAGPGDAYGDRLYPWVLSSIAILPPGTKPAVPGAGAEIAAGKGKERTMGPLMLMMLPAEDGGSGGGSGTEEGKTLTLEQLVEDVRSTLTDVVERLGKMEVKIETLEKKPATEIPAPVAGDPPAEGSEFRKAMLSRISNLEGGLTDAEIKHELDLLQDPKDFRLTKGDREAVEKLLEKATSSVEKQAIMAAVKVSAKSVEQGVRVLRTTGASTGGTVVTALGKQRLAHLEALKVDFPDESSDDLAVRSMTLKPDLWVDEE